MFLKRRRLILYFTKLFFRAKTEIYHFIPNGRNKNEMKKELWNTQNIFIDCVNFDLSSQLSSVLSCWS